METSNSDETKGEDCRGEAQRSRAISNENDGWQAMPFLFA